MSEPRPLTARELAIAVHAAAVQGVDPRSATRSGVSARLTSRAPFWIIALGKAAGAMADAAAEVLREHNADLTGGISSHPSRPAPHHP
jgi:glycerate-2-kinase